MSDKEWIAENVMGWKRTWLVHSWNGDSFGGMFIGGHFYTEAECAKACEGYSKARQNRLFKPRESWETSPGSAGCYFVDSWDPTDPAAAMMVLEKCLSSDKLTMPIEIDRKRHKAGRFRLESGQMLKPFLAIEDTLPLAICLFAKSLFHK